jgi:hypothetical protein
VEGRRWRRSRERARRFAEGEEGGIEERREASVEDERTRAHLQGSVEASAAMWKSKDGAEQ